MKPILLFVILLPTIHSKKTYQLIFPTAENFPHATLYGTIDHPLKDYTLCHWTKIDAEFEWGTIFSYHTEKILSAVVTWLSDTGNCNNRIQCKKILFSPKTTFLIQDVFYQNNEPMPQFNSGVDSFNWLHSCLVSSTLRGSWKVYINGIVARNGTSSKKMSIPPNGIVTLGQYHTKSDVFVANRSFLGCIADVYMWDYTLSAKDIAKVYACDFAEEANVINWNLHTWQPFNGVHLSSVKLPCGTSY